MYEYEQRVVTSIFCCAVVVARAVCVLGRGRAGVRVCACMRTHACVAMVVMAQQGGGVS